MSKPQYEKARIYKTKMPYNPYNHAPFGITTWAKIDGVRIRIYQDVGGSIRRIEVIKE